MKPGGAPGGVFRSPTAGCRWSPSTTATGAASARRWSMPALADDPRFVTPALRLANDVGALRRRPSDPRRRSRGPTGAERLTEARPDARAPEQLRRVPRPAAGQQIGLIQWLGQAGLDRAVPVPALPGMLPPGRRHAARHRARHRPAHRRDPGRSTATRRPRSTPCWPGAWSPTAPRAASPDHAPRPRAATSARRGRTAAASPSTSPGRRRLALRPHADHGRRRRSPTMPASTACRCWSPAAGWCCRRRDGEIDVRAPFRPVRFAGETPIVSRLEAGPVEVVNLIGDRSRVALDLAVLGPGGRQRLGAWPCTSPIVRPGRRC